MSTQGEGMITEDTRPDLDNLKCLLNQKARVLISDGRIFIGYFACVDKQSNVILRFSTETVKGHTRDLGLCMIPGDHIKKFEIETR